MKLTDFEQADDSGYQLRALLRTMEDRARGLGEEDRAADHRLACSDLALLCEVAGDLCESLHDMLQTLEFDNKALRDRLAIPEAHS